MGKDPHTRFLELHMANQRDIFNYLLAAVHDFQDAEDLLQDVTLVLWKKFDQYKEEFPFLRWALGIARREVARYWRRKYRQPALAPFDVLDSLAGAMEENGDLLAAERRALVQCVQRLPDDQRELLHMRYHRGRSLEELARHLRKTLAAVNMTLVRIRQVLLKCTERVLASEA